MLQTRHILSTGTATLINALLGFALTFLVARLLSPTDNGHYAQFIFIMNLVYITFNFGIGTSNTYFIASEKWSLTEIKFLNIKFMLYLMTILILTTLILKKYLIIEALDKLLNTPEFIIYIGISSGLILTGFYQISSILMGMHKYDKANILNITRNILPVFLILLSLLFFDENLKSITITQTLALLISLGFGLLLIKDKEKKSIIKSNKKNKELIKYSSISYLSNLFHFLAMRGVLIAISYYSLPKEVGYYNIALLLLEGVLLLPSIIGQLLFPQASTLYFSPAVTEKLLRINLMISFLIMLMVIFLSDYIIYIILGKNYLEVSILLLHLSPSIILMVIPRLMSQVLSGLGHPKYPLIAAAISLLFGIPLALWLIPTNGIVGAAWVTNLTTLITAIITINGYSHIQKRKLHLILSPQKNDISSIKFFKKRIKL